MDRHLNHLDYRNIINAIPGGIAAYDLTSPNRPHLILCSDGIAPLLGCTNKQELYEYCSDPWSIIFKDDYQRVRNAYEQMPQNGGTFNLSCRIIKKDGSLNWMRLDGKIADGILYIVLAGMSEEAKLFQQIINETAHGIYVVDKNNYDLLYYNENIPLLLQNKTKVFAEKCYSALRGNKQPCHHCPLNQQPSSDKPLNFQRADGRSFEITTSPIQWNERTACILFINDVTDKLDSIRKTQRLEQFYQTLVRNLPGGIAVIRFDTKKNLMMPEYISESFAAMTGMTLEEAYDLYRRDATAGVHPDDIDHTISILRQRLNNNLDTCESIYRLRKGDGSYIWVKNNSSLLLSDNYTPVIYAIYTDVTKDIEAQDRLRQKYNEVLFRQQNYPLANEILSGYCNITANKIIRIYDKTGCNVLERFGYARQDFFQGLSSLIESESERELFLARFLNEPLLSKFAAGITQQKVECFVRLPGEDNGRYLKCVINMLEAPDNGDIIGVLSVVDLTSDRIREKISQHLAHAHYDFIAACDLSTDRYHLMYINNNATLLPPEEGHYSESYLTFSQQFTVPKDRKLYAEMLNPAYVKQRLSQEGSYSFHYSLRAEDGNIYTKNIIVFLIDARMHKFGLARADITEYVREQRALLNTLAYTFEQLTLIDLTTKEYTIYTRQSVLDNLIPVKGIYNNAIHNKITAPYAKTCDAQTVSACFEINSILNQLNENPQGYDLTLPYDCGDGELKHKQINVLWGDENHQTICMVRCDVTHIVKAEQSQRQVLENALMLAQEANQAKTNFLSAMSHDIRTPMNAIIGMADLALDTEGKSPELTEYLGIIKNSSLHLLTLINDILDMSRIEKGQLTLEQTSFNLATEVDNFCCRYQLLMDKKQLHFKHFVELRHSSCIGDATQLQRIWDNLIGNACKFTPSGGTVSFEVRELPPKSSKIGWYQFVISDTGIGIDRESLPLLFDPFYRSHTVINKHIEGSGLGLSIVKNIVDYIGGTITVASSPGEGTTFTVTVPLHFDMEHGQQDESLTGAEAAANFDFSGLTFLLVEDHPINQMVAELILEKTGATVVIAENGADGVEKFTTAPPGTFAAILMDIQMPVMNGYEAAQAIRASRLPHSQSVPIIAMTANAFAEDIKNSLTAGMNAHIAKPIDPQKLYETLAKYLQA